MAGVPGVNAHAVEFLEAAGFSGTPPSLPMVYGNREAESCPATLIAIANGAVG